MKSKQLKSYNLSPDRTYNELLDAKPYGLFVALVVVGILFLVYLKLTSGAILITISIFSAIVLPSRRLIEFYDDNMIIYNKASRNDCFNIYYSDVISWTYNQRVTDDDVTFFLKDGTSQSVDAYSKILFEKRLNKYMKDKNVKGDTIWKFQKH